MVKQEDDIESRQIQVQFIIFINYYLLYEKSWDCCGDNSRVLLNKWLLVGRFCSACISSIWVSFSECLLIAFSSLVLGSFLWWWNLSPEYCTVRWLWPTINKKNYWQTHRSYYYNTVVKDWAHTVGRIRQSHLNSNTFIKVKKLHWADYK